MGQRGVLVQRVNGEGTVNNYCALWGHRFTYGEWCEVCLASKAEVSEVDKGANMAQWRS